MILKYSNHWKIKRNYRKIDESFLEYAIINSAQIKDRKEFNVLNVICRIPPSGRILKVVYKRISINKVKIITAYWLD